MKYWLEVTIAEILAKNGGSIKTGPFGTTLKAAEYSEEGVPVISVGEVGEGSLRLHNRTPRVSPETTARLSEYLLEAGDVVFGRKGAVERSAWVNPEQEGWFLGSDGIRLRLSPKTDSRYVAYCLQTEHHKSWMLTNCVGTTMHSLNQGVIERIPIPLPPLETQRRIAAILSAFDDKIELNRRMNRTLEAMARALFKSWFVDFEPVRAKMRGEAPLGMDAQTAALFPETLLEVDGREVPTGWEWKSVNEGFNLTMGQSPPGDTYNQLGDGLPFYQGKTDFGFRFPKPRVYCTAPTRLANIGDVLISVRAPVGDANIATEVCAIGRGVAAIRHFSGDTSFTYYCMCENKDFFDRFDGEGTVFGSINKTAFESLMVIEPCVKILESFEKYAGEFDRQILVNENESAHLEQLRDALLPRLLSGELDVESWEEKV